MAVGKKGGGSAPAKQGGDADTKGMASTLFSAMKKAASVKQKSNEEKLRNGGAPASSQDSATSARGKVIGGRGGNDRSHSAAHLACCCDALCTSAALGFAYHSQVNPCACLRGWHKHVHFGAGKSPGSPDW